MAHGFGARSGNPAGSTKAWLVAVSTSCSLLHVPYSLEREQNLNPEVKNWLAFGAEKINEVATLSRLLRGEGTDADKAAVEESTAAVKQRAESTLTHNAEVRARQGKVTDAGRTRDDISARRDTRRQS